MRICISDDEDFQNQALLWDANCRRSIKGRAGQAALRELEAALLALPNKRLIANNLKNADGDVCAIGALALLKNYSGDWSLPTPDIEFNEDVVERAMLNVAAALSVPRMVAISIIYENDDYYGNSTPEKRYERVLKWVQRQIVTEKATAGI